MNNELLDLLHEEIGYLERWINTSKSGGWSTHNVASMKQRLAELKSRAYKLMLK